MAIEKDGKDEADMSKVRARNKREFEFALRSLSEIGESMSQQRVRKLVNESQSDVNGSKRKAVAENDSTHVTSDDGDDYDDERKRNGKGKVKCVPSKLKELLQTGLLEDLNVRYIRGIKSGHLQNWIPGKIKGTSILCFCKKCNGDQIVTPSQFELHANSANKRPADYIYLQNQKTLRYVLNACKDATLDNVTDVILNEIGSSPETNSAFCHGCKERINGASTESMMLCDACSELNTPLTRKNPKQADGIISESVDSKLIPGLAQHVEKTWDTAFQASSSSNINQNRLLISSKQADGWTDKFIQRVYPERICNIAPIANGLSTRGQEKPLTFSKQAIDTSDCTDSICAAIQLISRSVQSGTPERTCNTGPEGSSSSTKSQPNITLKSCLKGTKKALASPVSPSQFESHAGDGSRKKPYRQICTTEGVSLNDIPVNLTIESGVRTDEKDTCCYICSESENLLRCYGCPKAFHLHCSSLSSMQNGKYYCKACTEKFQMERFAARNTNAIAADRIPRGDPMEQITNRCIRIVKPLDPQDSACALCRTQDYCISGFEARTVILCDQCDKEYHVGCLKEHKIQDLKELPEGDWFCSSDCGNINSALEELLSKGYQNPPDVLVHVIKEKLPEELTYGDDLEIRWRVLHGRKSSIDEIRPLLGEAVSVFHEQFAPILYGPHKQDLIPHMVYGVNIKEIEFGGMYCTILSINSTIVSAGVFRVFSKDVAEIPLIATSIGFEGKGYFQCLYYCIENFLKGQGVKHLMMPAAKETRSLWINKFGFNVKPQELNELTTLYPLMHFDGTLMLHKLLNGSSS